MSALVASGMPGLGHDAVAAVLPGLNEVEVWQASLDEQPGDTLSRLEVLLSSDELKRAASFHFARDRRRFVAARGILRTLLGSFLERDPREVALAYGEQGKPVLAGEGDIPALAFNVAHADGFALFALTRRGEVGVDVERIRTVGEWEAIAQAHFSAGEGSRLSNLPADERDREFLRAWTRHEAILKAHGTGLGGGIPPVAAGSFRVYSWTPAPGFIGAIAVPGGVHWFAHRLWPASPDELDAAPQYSRMPLSSLSESSPNLP